MTLTLIAAGLALAAMTALAYLLAALCWTQKARLQQLERRYKMLQLAHDVLLVEHERLLDRADLWPSARN